MIFQTRSLFTALWHWPDSMELVVNVENIYIPFTYVATSYQIYAAVITSQHAVTLAKFWASKNTR